MDAFLVLSPHFIENLQTNHWPRRSDHRVWYVNGLIIQAQTDFIIKGLNLFKNMGLPGCWLVYWNSAYDSYGIRGTVTETAVGEWIAKNTN
jgi:hypothetical protein